MKTAIITGASSGLGREFVRQLTEVFPEVECVWLIARRRERLEEMAQAMPDVITECLSLDLCDPMSFSMLQGKLASEQPDIALLVNCAGCGFLGNLGEVETATQTRMVDLNVRALTAITNMALPFMERGSRILNVSSIAAFCPTPGMTVYSASKSYVSSFSRGLAEELRRQGITVTAVCPAPMKTEFLAAAGIRKEESRKFRLLPYCDQVQVAGGALRAARAGRGVYTPRLLYKTYRLLAKLTPSRLMVRWTRA